MFYDTAYHVIELQAYFVGLLLVIIKWEAILYDFSRINELDIRSGFVREMNQEKWFSTAFSSWPLVYLREMTFSIELLSFS